VCKEPSITVDALTRGVSVEQRPTTAREAFRAKLSMLVAKLPSEERRELLVGAVHKWIVLRERREG
jgi:hypothetical protein